MQIFSVDCVSFFNYKNVQSYIHVVLEEGCFAAYGRVLPTIEEIVKATETASVEMLLHSNSVQSNYHGNKF